MITRLGMAPRRSGLSTVDFARHWEGSHAEVAGRIPGLRRYVQLHQQLIDGQLAFPYPGFDACSELDFDSLEDMDAGFSSELYRRDVRADEDAFIDKSRFSLLLAERRVVRPGDGGGDDVRLVTLLRRHPAATRDEFESALTGAYAEVVGQHAPGRHEQLLALDTGRAGREVAACDAVDSLHFPSAQAALSYARSEAAVTAALALAGVTFGAAHLLARPVVVVG